MKTHILLLSMVFLVMVLHVEAKEIKSNYSYHAQITMHPEVASQLELGISFDVQPFSNEGFSLLPRVGVLDLETGNLCAASSPRKTEVLGNDGSQWKSQLHFSCDQGLIYVNGPPKDLVRWRLMLVDDQQKEINQRPSQVFLRGLQTKEKDLSDGLIEMSVKGAFEPRNFVFEVDGYSVVGVEWVEDTHKKRLASYLLKVELRSEAEVSQALREIELELQGQGKPKFWPETILWFQSMDGALRISQRLPSERRFPTSKALKVPVPEAFRNTDFELQATAHIGTYGLFHLQFLHTDRAQSLNQHFDSKETARAVLAWPALPWLELPVEVRDRKGAPVDGATVYAEILNPRTDARLRFFESETGDDGRAVLLLMPPRSEEVWLMCTKKGWSFQYLPLKGSSGKAQCVLEKLPPMAGRDTLGIRPSITIQTTDAVTRRPIAEASVQVFWKGEETSTSASHHGEGLWTVPNPQALSGHADIRVHAPCYTPTRRKVHVPSQRGPVDFFLEPSCTSATLSLKLLQAGFRLPIKGAEQAVASIQQMEGSPHAVQFRSDGYSLPRVFAYNPNAGPVVLHVEAPGYSPVTKELHDFEARIGEGGFVRDIEIEMRPSGRGLAVLLNAAESWSAYPYVRKGVIRGLQNLQSSKHQYSRLVVGILDGDYRMADLEDLRAAKDILGWLAGASASGGMLAPMHLGQRLSSQVDFLPQAAAWDLVLVVPFNELVENHKMPEGHWTTLVDHLRSMGVVLYVIEDGGGQVNAYFQPTQSLGGKVMGIAKGMALEDKAESVSEQLVSLPGFTASRGDI